MCTQENNNNFSKAKTRMLNRHLKGRDITSKSVLKAMAEIPREEFVPESYLQEAYSDGPLPIGMEQTISQPYIVALMTQALYINSDCEVLEIGTGSGYQTAVLSKLAKKVYTVERFAELSESAQAILGKLDINNVEFHTGDGSCGWPESRLPKSGYFDRVIITAAVPAIPKPLLGQLADGGFLVGPVGYGGAQELVVCEKRGNKLIERVICDVRFVRLIGEYGFNQ
ncbi:MAG: protein-L-isoaspartate(D-aspartate) O-methyltransferase [Sedimentisphaerales bacterium]|nr:protein-L-isoaspartate(D-aspartate) O-methyltransferase [Sedimentisphaerales bacterium]